MATEGSAARSSGSADSYIGSLISLTSKSEIRYEGILFNINTDESSIGLRNVRSFGTEGRKRDGPQVPPSDKIYEYILFRGSDIKDLQVKSSPPVQTAASIHNDPAIIQSQYLLTAPDTASSNMPSASSGSVSDLSSHSSQPGPPIPMLQGGASLNKSGGNLGSWGPSQPPPTTCIGGADMSLYRPGLYGPSVDQQLSLFRPPHHLSMPSSMQQPMQYPAISTSLPFSSPNLPTPQILGYPPPLLPPIPPGNSNFQATLLPRQSSPLPSDASANLVASSAPQVSSLVDPTTSLPVISLLNSCLERNPISSTPNKPILSGPPILSYGTASESIPSGVGTSNSLLNDPLPPTLVTPGQLLQPGLTTSPLSQTSQTAQKDVELVQVKSSEAPAPLISAVAQPPILPLPTPQRKFGRPVTKFTEDFDFEAMNEKFNKEEVWGHLGKSNNLEDEGHDSQEVDMGSSKVEAKY
ncbi:Lsm14-like, N-terminal [Dillenia turbinata]|uniref:Lsm14-like, N-terminal n=1 Tax=Dillenia turbinata TaxID=194707 RepID=A0AAN8VET0_9MAGN